MGKYRNSGCFGARGEEVEKGQRGRGVSELPGVMGMFCSSGLGVTHVFIKTEQLGTSELCLAPHKLYIERTKTVNKY